MKSVLSLQKFSKQPSMPVIWLYYVVFIFLDHQWFLSLNQCSSSVRMMSPSCFTSCAYSGIQESVATIK